MRRAWRSALVVALAVLAVVLAAASGDAAAQCAMCGLSADAAAEPEVVRRTFAAAVLMLLVPTTLLLGGTGFLLWKFRDGGPRRPPSAGIPEAPRRRQEGTAPRGEVVELRRRSG